MILGKETYDENDYAADFNDVARTITCTKEAVQEFNTSVTEEGYFENIAIDFWDAQANDYFINGSNIKGDNLSDITYTIDGEDVIQIQPPQGAGNDALFVCRFVNYKDEYMTLKNFVSMGTRMKVSFSYKGVGTRVEVTSREAGGGNTQQAPNAEISATEWKTFEYEFDNSKIPITNEQRWIGIRLKTASGTNPYMCIKDFEITYPEEKSIDHFSGNGDIKVAIETPTGSRTQIPYTCYVAEYLGNELVNMVTAKEGNTKDAGDNTTYYKYTPTTGDKIKVFLWNGIDALCELTEVTKQ